MTSPSLYGHHTCKPSFPSSKRQLPTWRAVFTRPWAMEMLLEAEIAGKVDELYARDQETQLSGRATEIAHRTEVERMDAFRRAMTGRSESRSPRHAYRC